MSNYNNVMMIDVSVSKYEGRKGDKNAGHALDSEKNVKGKGHSVSKIACDAEEMSGYIEPYNKFKTWLKTNCLPIGDNRYLVQIDKYSDAVQKADEFKTAFWKGVSTFVNNFDEIVEKQKYRLNDAWDYNDYPRDISKKFDCHILFTSVPDASSIRNFTGLPAEEVDKLVKENEDAVRSLLETAMKTPFKRIFEVVKHMAETLGDETARFKNSLVNNVQELIDLIPQLNITNSQELSDLAERLSTELIVQPDVLRYDLNKRKEVSEKAEKVMADLEGYF